MFFRVLFINIASFVCKNKDVGNALIFFTFSFNLSWNSSFVEEMENFKEDVMNIVKNLELKK